MLTEMIQSMVSLYLAEYSVSAVGSLFTICPLGLILHPNALLC